MRDPKRINAIIEDLRALWTEHPDERLCQLLINTLRFCEHYERDALYQLEDDELRSWVRERLYERGEWAKKW